MSGTFALSWGRYGGFYLLRWRTPRVGKPWRLCLGRIALTYLPVEIDDMLRAYVKEDAA